MSIVVLLDYDDLAPALLEHVFSDFDDGAWPQTPAFKVWCRCRRVCGVGLRKIRCAQGLKCSLPAHNSEILRANYSSLLVVSSS